MPDEPKPVELVVSEPSQPIPKEQAVTELLEAVRKKNERYLRNKQAVAFLSAVIPDREKLLKDFSAQLMFYAESVPKLKAQLDQDKIRLDFALTFLRDHAEDGESIKIAEETAKKIMKLQAQLVEKRLQVQRLLGQIEA